MLFFVLFFFFVNLWNQVTQINWIWVSLPAIFKGIERNGKTYFVEHNYQKKIVLKCFNGLNKTQFHIIRNIDVIDKTWCSVVNCMPLRTWSNTIQIPLVKEVNEIMKTFCIIILKKFTGICFSSANVREK